MNEQTSKHANNQMSKRQNEETKQQLCQQAAERRNEEIPFEPHHLMKGKTNS